MNDISPNFSYNEIDAEIGKEILKYEATPFAIVRFSQLCTKLTDYAYWFYLSTLWVSYSGYSDLKLWKRLFRAGRDRRSSSIMKPSELEIFNQLPEIITAYRTHRPGETDWISYTLDTEFAVRYGRERGVSEYVEYRIKKKDVIALFLRRGEQEILMLDHWKTEKVRSIHG